MRMKFEFARWPFLLCRKGMLLGCMSLALLGPLGSASGQTFDIPNDQNIATAFGWQGGAGPFLLQRKLNLSDPNWLNLLTTSNNTAIVPKDSQSSFFRFQNQTTNSVMAFGLFLDGPSEVPAVNNTSATAIGTLSLEGSNLTYQITFSGLSAPATAAHIHAPATPTVGSGVLVPLRIPPATAGSMSGTLVLDADQIAYIITGMAYVNIHTANNPNGEIRSQVVPLHIPMTLNGASEVPTVATSATGSGSLTLLGSQLLYEINYSGLAGSATASHLHGPADATTSAGVLEPLAAPTGTSGTISGRLTLTPTELGYLLAGQTYINIHSTAHVNGEIRGQIWPVQLGAGMNGASEVPSNGSAGTGNAFLTVLNDQLAYKVSFAGLTSAANGGHIHGPAYPGQNANVLIAFSGVPAATSGTFSGTATIDTLQLFYLITGQTYVNIHTANNGNGEIRGQVMPAN